MDTFTKEDLRELTEAPEGWAVSIYMPTHRKGREVEQDPTRFKNLLDEAEEQLIAAGFEPPEARAFLATARDFAKDALAWQYASQGLAFFITEETYYAYRLPVDFNSLVVVAPRFHVKPLLPLLSKDGEFYVLALSQDKIRLLRGTRHTVEELDPDALPDDLVDALGGEEYTEPLMMQMSTRDMGGQTVGANIPSQKGRKVGDRQAQPKVFSGHAAEEEEPKKRIRKFFQRLDDQITRYLGGTEKPLVLAGIDFLLPIYREANSYPHLIEEEEIIANTKIASPEELHDAAWEIVEPRFAADREEDKTRYQELKANAPERVSQDLETIVSGAYFERVDTLFVAQEMERWGTFDPETNEVTVYEEKRAEAEDLLDLAAVHTLFNEGAVYMMEPADMPDELPAAAILRF